MILGGICASEDLSSAQYGAQPFPGLQERCGHRHVVLEVASTDHLIHPPQSDGSNYS